MLEDASLIEQILAGDNQAFHHLMDKYQSAIYGLIRFLVQNPDDAQELTQEVFLKAYKELGSLKQPERFGFWINQIARNQCQDWRRKNQVEFSELPDNIIADIQHVDESLIFQETLAKVMQAINELPEIEKQLLKERYLDDSSYAELQAKHGLSYKALNMRLLRARQKVKARVEKSLAIIGIFSWQDALKKMILGGVEAVKISAKVKIVTIGVASVLILGGVGIIIWNSQGVSQEVPTPEITKQSSQKTSNSTFGNNPVLYEPTIKEPAKIEETHTYSEPQKKENQTFNTLGSVKNEEKTINTEEYEMPTKADIMLKEFRADMIPVAEGIDKEVPKRMVEGFFVALKNKDFTTAYEIAGADLRFKLEDTSYAQITEFTIGEPFQKEGREYAAGRGLFVPYELNCQTDTLRNGKLLYVLTTLVYGILTVDYDDTCES
ncbi:MAG: sigma-70 family RNA polymerase sigma factor [Candidatus Poribacteria bacterium]